MDNFETQVLKALADGYRTLPGIKHFCGIDRSVEIDDLLEELVNEEKIFKESNGDLTAFFRPGEKPVRFWRIGGGKIEVEFERKPGIDYDRVTLVSSQHTTATARAKAYGMSNSYWSLLRKTDAKFRDAEAKGVELLVATKPPKRPSKRSASAAALTDADPTPTEEVLDFAKRRPVPDLLTIPYTPPGEPAPANGLVRFLEIKEAEEIPSATMALSCQVGAIKIAIGTSGNLFDCKRAEIEKIFELVDYIQQWAGEQKG